MSVTASLGISHLQAASLSEPIGIDDMTPSLSWRLDGPGTLAQRSARILVASSRDVLETGHADLWDSGLLEGADTVATYAGTTLRSHQICFWRVEIETGAGETVISPIASWEMGVLSANEWQGAWLAAESAIERDDREAAPAWAAGPLSWGGPARQFRLAFQTTTRGKATIILGALGTIETATLDGTVLIDSNSRPYWDPNAFGGPPALTFTVEVDAGGHELFVAVKSNVGPLPQLEAAITALIRVDDENGHFERITSGWESRATDADTWGPPNSLSLPLDFPWPVSPGRLLRHSFNLDGGVASARLYVAALGAYEVSINGERAGDAALQPDPTDFRVTVPYQTFDVTTSIRRGENVIGATVADGFFASYMAPTGRYSFGPAPRRIKMMLIVWMGSGEVRHITTNEEWCGCESAIRSSEIYNGEHCDLRAEPIGWDRPGYTAEGWTRCWAVTAPAGSLVAPLGPPIRAITYLKPQKITAKGGRRHIVDFGQNFAGRLRLRVCAATGTKITLRHAEILNHEGELDVANLRAAEAEDSFILAADGLTELEPRFVYHGFRYAEVRGVDSLDEADVDGVVLSTDLLETGTIEIGNPVVQKLWQNTLWSQRSNFVGIPTDCPQRDERLGWTGDAQIFWDTAAFNADILAFTRSYTREMRNAQGTNGAFPMWAPQSRLWHAIASTPLAGWADAGVQLPFTTYLHSGDRRIIDDNHDAMARYLDGILVSNPDHVWRNGRGFDLGDWLSLDAKNPFDETTPKTLIATAMLARSLGQLAQMCEWTNRPAGAWREHERKVRTAFAAQFVTPDGMVGNGSHTSFILALRLDLVPANLRAQAAALLAANIRERGMLLSTGFLGTPYALDALADAGEIELAYSLLLRTDYPSWGYMVEKGATTIWERWNGDHGDVAMNSYNHYALGAVCSFLYRRTAGIQPIEPGFGRFAIAPLPDRRIPSARARFAGPRGTIVSGWTIEAGRTKFEIEVPANSFAELNLPGPVLSDAVAFRYNSTHNRSEAVAGPGRYVFESSLD